MPRDTTEGASSAAIIPHIEPAGGTTSVDVAESSEPGKLRRFLSLLGPGLVTGASDDDPSGIGTYATAGASFGFSTLWMAPFSFPLMAAVQYTCAKVGMVSGMGLAGVLKRNYPRWVLYPAVAALVVANTINAGADLGAIAAGINIFVKVPIPLLVIPVTLIILALQIWGSYRLIANVFKWLTLALLAYVATAFFTRPDLGAVARGSLIPTLRFDQNFLATIVAILGTTISPYLFFWQASQEVEEEISRGRTSLRARRGATDDELQYASWDVNIGMLLSNVVMYFIILTTAATLFVAGQHEVNSAADAAKALRPLAGNAAELLLAIGLIGSGFLAVPILVGAGAYGVAETFGWRHGLDKNPARARQFYLVIVASTIVGMGINFIGIDPIKALFWSAMINGLLAPPLLLVIMLVANNDAVMGNRRNGRWLNLLTGLATLIMFAAAIGLVATLGQ